MTVFVALLRGVNVGGAQMIRMADFRAMLEGLGYEGARTHLQSGNAVFSTGDAATKVGPAIEEAIHAKLGFRPRVLLRTREELDAVLKAAPDWPEANPSRVVVMFLEGDPGAELVTALEAVVAPEPIEFRDREIWIDHLNGISKSELGKAKAWRLLKTGHTTRNLNTVRSLAAMAAEVQGAST